MNSKGIALGNITKDWYEALHKLWNWIPDTANLSKSPLKTKIAFVYGKNSEGILKIAVDTNNNLDLSDDELFSPLELTSLDWSKVDSLAKIYAIDVSFETFIHNKIVSVSAPLFIVHRGNNVFMCSFSQYLSTQYNGEQIAVSSGNFGNLSYSDIGVVFERNELKNGTKVKNDNIYRKNQNVIIKDEIYKILGVNTNKNTLVLEKTDLPKTQFFSTNVGYKPYPFQGEEFTTKEMVSLESLRGKYVLLDFFGTWCMPCISEISSLKELYAKTDRAKFEIIGIVGRSPSDALRRLINNYSIDWPQIISNETSLLIEKYGISKYPTTFLLDPEGVIIAIDLRGKELEEKVLSLIKN